MKRRALPFPSPANRAFTLIEVLVACTISIIILGLLLSILNQTVNIWSRNNARLEAFQSARRGFENITQFLGQATLNTYWDYRNSDGLFRDQAVSGKFVPADYGRKSELHFVTAPSGSAGLPGTTGCGQAVFFLAPATKNDAANTVDYERFVGLLNACGFYVEYNSDAPWLPPHVDPALAKERFRLMQFVEDTEALTIGTQAGSGWIKPTGSNTFPLADNVIALVIWPKENATPSALNSYSYDSRAGVADTPQGISANQLPPILQVAIVAVQENSVARLGDEQKEVIEGCLKGLFLDNPEANFSTDLAKLEKNLQNNAIEYRVFVSSVPMREAKWGVKP